MKIPETIEPKMRLRCANPTLDSCEVVEVAKIDHHGIWLMTAAGVMIREPVTREQLIAFDYELVEEEDNTI